MEVDGYDFPQWTKAMFAFTLPRVRNVESGLTALQERQRHDAKRLGKFVGSQERRITRLEESRDPERVIQVPYEAEVFCPNCLMTETWVIENRDDDIRARRRCPRCWDSQRLTSPNWNSRGLLN